MERRKRWQMVWTCCSACGLRTEWRASCSECGAANPLYRPSPSSPAGSDTRPAETVIAGNEPDNPWQLWGFSAALLLMFGLALAAALVVVLVVPRLFW